MTIYQITAKIPSENIPAVIYNSSLQNDRAYALPDVSLDGECGKAGTLEFAIPYGHPYYSRLTKLTTEIVFTQDNEELFRGRVYEIRTDIETERTVTCEGNLSYLVDSLQPPDRIKGKDTHTVEYDSDDGETSYSKEYSIDKEEGTKETLEAHFRRLVNKHNSQVEAWKQFAVGEITIDEKATEITFDDSSYRTTLDALESDLINLYGGWLRTRRVGNTTYLDWLKDYGTTSTQTFNFGQNIVEFDYTSNAEDLFTILVPVGDDGLTIESVNNGKIGIENASGIATFGKIYKTESFSGVTDAAKLKSLGEKYMQRNYKDPKRSISVTAVDMHLIDPSVRAFHLGDKIRLIAPVQGIDETIECLSYTITPNDPENNTYELGDRDETMSQKWTKDVDKSAADAANAARSARAGGGGVGQLFKYMWEQGHDLYANYDNIRLTANRVTATIENMELISGDLAKVGSQVAINKEGIKTLVTKTGVEELDPNETIFSRIMQQADKISLVVQDVGGEQKIKAASIVAEINKQTGQSQVRLSADQIDLDGLIRKLSAKQINVIGIEASGEIEAKRLIASSYVLTPAVYIGSSVAESKSIASGIWDVTLSGPVGNVYTLKKTLYNGSEFDIGSFSRATTLSRSWSGGEITVTAAPQGNTLRCAIFDVVPSDITWNGNVASFPLYANLDGNETKYPTGKTLRITCPRYVAVDEEGQLYFTTNSDHGVALPQPITHTVDDLGTEYDVHISLGNNYFISNFSIPKSGSGGDKLVLDPQSSTISVGSTGTLTSATVTVDYSIGAWDSVNEWRNVTIVAKVNGTVMARSTIHVIGPHG